MSSPKIVTVIINGGEVYVLVWHCEQRLLQLTGIGRIQHLRLGAS